MNLLRARLEHRDEQGVAIVLALAFIVLVGVITTALLSSLTSAVNNRVTLDKVRDREYAADAAIEGAIARVRGLTNISRTPCGGPDTPAATNGISIRVDCTDTGIPSGGVIIRNVVFTACLNTNTACTNASAITRAQANYEQPDGATTPTSVTVQQWSVDG